MYFAGVDRVRRCDLRPEDNWLNRGQRLGDLVEFCEAAAHNAVPIPNPRPELSSGGLLSQLHRAFAGSVPHQAPDSAPHLVTVGIWAYMTLNATGMCWCLWSVMPEPLPTYNRFQNFLYRRRAGFKPWLHRTEIAIFAINLAIGITIRFTHGITDI
jgi:hypothetical protein